MKKVMISMPMGDIFDADKRNFLFRDLMDKGYEVLDNWFPSSNPVKALGQSIDLMAEADVIFFARGWEVRRGCKIEHSVAVAYEIERMYEDESSNPELRDSVPEAR